MVFALQTEGESISKLEKADVLELTVRHLRKLKSHGALGLETDRYTAGYSACATEVGRVLSTLPDTSIAPRLMSHLGQRLNGTIETHVAPVKPLSVRVAVGPDMRSKVISPGSDSDQGYISGRESCTPSPTER